VKTQILDSPAKRISIAVAVLTGLILVAAAAYTFLGSSASKPVNGLKIIAAARAFTRSLRQEHLPIPPAVPLQLLIDQGLLQPADIGSFQGLDAKISLMASNGSPSFELMRVHLTDGSDLVLFADGSAQQTKR
jgi:hypothetical protein